MVRPFLSGQHADELRGDAERTQAVADGRSRAGIIDHMRRLAQGKQFQQLRVCHENARNGKLLAQLVDVQQYRQHTNGLIVHIVEALAHDVHQLVADHQRRSEPDGDLIGVRAR